MEEGEIWGRGGGNIFSLVTTHDTSAPHTVGSVKQVLVQFMYSSLHFFVNLGAIHVVHVHRVLWHFITGSQYVYNK